MAGGQQPEQDSRGDQEAQPVREIMSTDVLCVSRGSALAGAARRMAERNVGSAAVTDGGAPLGIVTERDVLRAVAAGRDPATERVEVWMTGDPVAITPETSVDVAMERMTALRVRHLPVVERDLLRGLVSMRDLVRARVCPRVPDRARVGINA